jgi:hypothetical protein
MESSQAISCGIGSISLEGSDNEFNCTCEAGYVGIAGQDKCSICRSGSYCIGGESINDCPSNSYCPNGTITPLSCGIGSVSPIRSDESIDCVCDGM